MEVKHHCEKLVLFSAIDPAGKNIARILRESYGFQEIAAGRWKSDDIMLVEIKGEVLALDSFEGMRPGIAVVASRHSSKTGHPSLTAHSPGNFSEARLGGQEKQLAIAPAIYLREALVALKRNGMGLDEYEISLEATHHGPTALPFPLLFAEVGSSEKEWTSLPACQAVARTIYDILVKTPHRGVKTAIGLGGGHYCRKFSQGRLTEEFAIGHICPKYALPCVDEDILDKMILRTEPRPEWILAEKRGLGSEKQRILDLVEKTGLQVELV